MTCGDFCARLGRWCFHCFLRWRLWIRPFFILSYIIVLCLLVPGLVLTCLGHECSKKQRTQLIGGIFVLMAIPISFWEITQHLVHYTKPYLQKHVIRFVVVFDKLFPLLENYCYFNLRWISFGRMICCRILWMVPIYGMDAVSLV